MLGVQDFTWSLILSSCLYQLHMRDTLRLIDHGVIIHVVQGTIRSNKPKFMPFLWEKFIQLEFFLNIVGTTSTRFTGLNKRLNLTHRQRKDNVVRIFSLHQTVLSLCSKVRPILDQLRNTTTSKAYGTQASKVLILFATNHKINVKRQGSNVNQRIQPSARSWQCIATHLT